MEWRMSSQSRFGNAVVDLIPSLRGYARALTRDATDADDLVQETLTRALRYRDRYQDGTQLRAWLFTIMRNTFYTDVRKRARETTGPADCVSGQLTVDPVHDQKIAHRELMTAVDALPVQYREMIMLVIVLGESYEDAAALCGCAVGTVKSRVNRGRSMLVAALTKAPPAADAQDTGAAMQGQGS